MVNTTVHQYKPQKLEIELLRDRLAQFCEVANDETIDQDEAGVES